MQINRFVDGWPIANTWGDISEVLARALLLDATGKDLKQRGFKFVGSTITYVHMQATGMVDDRTHNCFHHAKISGLG